jgi:hypothetical protein
MAQAKTKPDDDDADPTPVEKFRTMYVAALAEAQVSAEHTNTEGWQSLYKNFMKADREGRRELAQGLKGYALQLEMTGLTEDDEKAIGDLKKRAAELREEREVFEAKTVEPVRSCVEVCQKVLNDARQWARAEQDRAPLTAPNLVAEFDAEFKRHPVATWDDETGRVQIVGPSAPGVN